MDDPVKVAATALRRAIDAHSAGNYRALSDIHNSIDEPLYLAISDMVDESVATNLNITRDFLDCWADASNHDWFHYDGISKDDWPIMARTIVGSLESGEPIVSTTILENFHLAGRTESKRRTFEWVLVIVVGVIAAYWITKT